MADNYTYLFFYTRQQEEIYDPQKYQQLVDGLVALQFYIALPGEAIDQKMLTAPGISSAMQQEVQNAQRATSYVWDLKAYSLDHSEPFGGVTFQMGNERMDETDEAYGALDMDYLIRLFDESDRGAEMYEHFLEALQLIYQVYHPIYAYQFDPRDGRAVTTREETLTSQIHTLYDINFFGPDLVEKIRRERLESAPAERVVPLDDGGIMLLPYVFLSPNSHVYNIKSIKQVADHLGLLPPPD